MTRALTSLLKTRLAANPHTMRRLLTIERPDGVTLRYTDSVRDLTINNQTYLSQPGFSTTALVLNNNGDIPTLDLTLPVGEELPVRPPEVLRGIWGNSRVTIDYCDRDHVQAGVMPVFEGLMGDAQMQEGQATFEVHGRLELMRSVLVETYGPTCRADLGDRRCRWPLLDHGRSGTVEQNSGRGVIVTMLDYPPNGYLDGGVIVWQSGDNAGFAQEVRQWTASSRRIAFWVMPRFGLKEGDEFTVYPGCNKQLSTCKNKFNNTANFQGEPYLPGSDLKLSFTTYTKITTTTTYVAEKRWDDAFLFNQGYRVNGKLPEDVTLEDIEKSAVDTEVVVEKY